MLNNDKIAINNRSAMKGRAVFATRFAAIATTVGSAVGLGNIWRFPYEAGIHGGGAFLICYLIFVILIGVPVLCAEFCMGRGTRSNISEPIALCILNLKFISPAY